MRWFRFLFGVVILVVLFLAVTDSREIKSYRLDLSKGRSFLGSAEVRAYKDRQGRHLELIVEGQDDDGSGR